MYIIYPKGFYKFETGKQALEDITKLTHREIPSDLEEFLKTNLPAKKKNISLAVVDNKLGKV
jgi:hypothetical protein